ncbi:ATP-NAD kinase-like domain-containing protein [Multifurca ochricompacta]|uniref:ATP-NAD kinase-like domain-containing protein n=1 Tax=Multifurca ochricompacta TaxID=376703 RepID=A0AAD4M616_9AGAM|nr:ATP-NAD kinase-like domain-containing protein [Multifurca ochricompacta]
MPLIVVYNPVSGDRSGSKLATETIVPLLISHSIVPDKVAATEYPGHAGTLLLSYIDSLTPSSRTEGITLVLISGDGTLHEIVNALHSARSKQNDSFPSLRIILIPGGTANALHASFFPPESASDAEPTLLASLLSFLSATPRLVPLTFAYTTISPPAPGTEPAGPSASAVVSTVVTSTSLHAAILHDSEALRASIPGIERFKLAAAQNATTWYRARARLLAPIQRYDITSGAFVPVTPNSHGNPEEHLELPGPFAYFLSTVNVDRLEPFFRIAPLQRTLPPPHGAQTMDVLIVRPLRDPSLDGKSGEAERERFKERLWEVLGAAYRDGAHIHVRYAEGDGKTDGPPVVEYFRVGGWEWIPEEDDEKARLLCADGAIFHAPEGGKLVSNVLGRTAHDFRVAIYA